MSYSVQGSILTSGLIRAKQPISLRLIDRNRRQPAQPQQDKEDQDAEGGSDDQGGSTSSQDSTRLAALEGQVTEMRADMDNLRTYIKDQFAAILGCLPPPSID